MIRTRLAQATQFRGPPPRFPSNPASGGDRAAAPLAGRAVLLVEDEAFLALDLYDTLEEAGARVIGPLASLTDALDAARAETFDAAILDIDLQGREVFPVASVLADKRIPFLFHTAHGRAALMSPDFATVPICAKPADPNRLIGILRDLLDKSSAN